MTCPHCDVSRPALGDLGIEMALLSCLIQAPDTQVDAAIRILKTEDFAHEHCGLLFDLISRRHANREPVDAVSLMSYVFDKGMQARISPAFIAEVIPASANPTQTTHYAQTVAEFSKRRQMVKIAADLARAALEGGNDEWQTQAVEVMRRADTTLMGKDGQELVHIGDVAQSYVDVMEKGITNGIDPVVHTGLSELDKLLDGGIRREYILIGGLQGHGKSLLAMQLAGQLAKDGRRGFVIGYDMTPLQVFMRDLARETGVPLNQIMGRAEIEGKGAFQDITRGISRMQGGWDIWYTKSPYMTFETAAAHARSLHRQKPLDWIILDFLQKVPLSKRSKERTDEALVALSRRVWALQRELGCTLIAPVQLNDDGLIREARGLLDDPEIFIRIEMEPPKDDADVDKTAGDDGWLRVIKSRFGVGNRRVAVFRNGMFQRFEDRAVTEPSPQPKPNKRTWNR